MEFACRGTPNDVDGGRRRLPGSWPPPPPPPPHGEGGLAPEDAALARRREELLWELDKARVHQDMILRELTEIERAMAARFTPAGHRPLPALPGTQDYWRCRAPSVPHWEDEPLVPPLAVTEHPSCRRGSPSARAPPVYPHVERSPSPSPIAPPRPADDVVQQRECRSARPRAQTFSGYVELSRSPSKRALEEEVEMPVAADAGVKRARSALFGDEVAPGHQRADVSRENKADVEDRHGVQPLYESWNQNSGQSKTAESAKEDRIHELVQHPYRHIAAGKENAACDQQKPVEVSENTKPHEEALGVALNKLPLIQPAPGHLHPGSDVMQKQEFRSSEARAHPVSSNVELRRSPNKQTLVEETIIPAAASASIRPTHSASLCKEVAQVLPGAVGGEAKDDMEDGHGVLPLREIRNLCSGQRKALESAMEAQTDKPVQPPCQNGSAGRENTANNGQKRIEFSESTPERTSSGLKRKLIAACQRDLDEHLTIQLHQFNAETLQARSKPAELHTKAIPSPNKKLAKNTEPSRRDDKENTAERRGLQQGEKPRPAEKMIQGPSAQSRWTCNLCQAMCQCELDFHNHLRGRRHRENKEAAIAGSKGSSDRKDGGDAGKNTSGGSMSVYFYCEICNVRCNSEKMMVSHLGGRRHRQMIEQCQ
ncbi:hypothetical protein ACP70R_006387 [Stipagrostis hirtigluma subsp. patula]